MRARAASSSTTDGDLEAFHDISAVQRSPSYTSPRLNQSTPINIPTGGTNLSDERIKDIFEELSANYLNAAAEERKRQDNVQLNQIQNILKDWTENITAKTKALVEDSLTAAASRNEGENINAALSDAQQRRSKILEDIKEAHNLQLQILKTEIAEERREAAQAQIVSLSLCWLSCVANTMLLLIGIRANAADQV
jgi:hypothetical protein